MIDFACISLFMFTKECILFFSMIKDSDTYNVCDISLTCEQYHNVLKWNSCRIESVTCKQIMFQLMNAQQCTLYAMANLTHCGLAGCI